MSRPGVVRLDGVFGVKGLGKPGTAVLDGSFAVSAPEPTIYLYDRGDWQPVAQRVWTPSGWFPPVT